MPISLLNDYKHEIGIYHLLQIYTQNWENPSQLKLEFQKLYRHIIGPNEEEYCSKAVCFILNFGSGYLNKNLSLNTYAHFHIQCIGKLLNSKRE